MVVLEVDIAVLLHVPQRTIGGVVALTAIFVIPVYVVWYWSRTGRTIGNVCLGIRVSRPGGGRLDVGTAVARGVCAGVSLLPAGLGFWFAVGPSKRAWHDRLPRTVVRRTHRRWDWRWQQTVGGIALALAEMTFALANLPGAQGVRHLAAPLVTVVTVSEAADASASGLQLPFRRDWGVTPALSKPPRAHAPLLLPQL
jgi:hypothetical protein